MPTPTKAVTVGQFCALKLPQSGSILRAQYQACVCATSRPAREEQASCLFDSGWKPVPPRSSSSLVRNAIGNRDWRSAVPSGCCPSRPVVGRTSPRASLLWHHLYRYTDPIIDNDQGCVEITPDSALFPPAVPESHMTVLREDLEEVPPGTTRRRLFPLHQKSIFISISSML
jgi:hypothetical protein